MTIKTLLSAILLLGATSPFAAASAAGPSTIEMQVDGLVCAFCAQGIEKTLRAQAATADVFVSLERHLVAVALKPDGTLTDATLRDVLTDAGYTVRSIDRTTRPLEQVRQAAAHE